MPEILKLRAKTTHLEGTYALPLSKSICNRAQLLKAFYPQLSLSGMSTSEDSQYLQAALAVSANRPTRIYVGAGGTTLRFALAFWSAQPGAEVVLEGTPKLNSRPIAPLVNALRALGASIEYEGVDGEAPLVVKGQKLQGTTLHLGHCSSSQFVTALMILGATLEQPLHLEWSSVPSTPYLVMTAALMRTVGIEVDLHTHGCSLYPTPTLPESIMAVEPDWSAMAFWCEAVALSSSADLFFPGFQEDSIQGDSKVLYYFEPLGVAHRFADGGVYLSKRAGLTPGKLHYNLVGEPDLAQALVTTLLCLRIPFDIHGLQTLRHKECDRLDALSKVAMALGAEMICTPSSLHCDRFATNTPPLELPFETLEDHRVAMSLAPLSLRMPIVLKHPHVVGKSYPEFWSHFAFLLAE